MLDVRNFIDRFIGILIFILIAFIGFLFFFYIKEYTAAVTWILSFSTIALVIITYIQSNKQYRKSLIEKQLEEFYGPLIERLTYPLSPVNGIIDNNAKTPRLFKIIKFKRQISKLLRTKGYLSDIPLYNKDYNISYVFKGYIGGEVKGKAEWEKWFFETEEERDQWTTLLKQLYKSYESLVKEYYNISGRDIKIQEFEIRPDKAFGVKPEGSKGWLG